MPYLHIIILALTGVHLPPPPPPPASAIVCVAFASLTAPGGAVETDAAPPLSLPYAASTVVEGRPVSPSH